MKPAFGLRYVLVAIGGPDEEAEEGDVQGLADMITKETGFKTTVADVRLGNYITYSLLGDKIGDNDAS